MTQLMRDEEGTDVLRNVLADHDPTACDTDGCIRVFQGGMAGMDLENQEIVFGARLGAQLRALCENIESVALQFFAQVECSGTRELEGIHVYRTEL